MMNSDNNLPLHKDAAVWPRRKFISAGLQLTGLAAFGTLPLNGFGAGVTVINKEYTVGEVIDLISEGCGFTPGADTVDTLKAGSREAKIKGIVTTMFPTIDVIRQTIKRGADFIIVHEPTYYSGKIEEASWLEGSSEVINRKRKLLNDNNITIWRAHDCIHKIKPDGVTTGVIAKLGWKDYYKGEKTFTIPAMSFAQLVKHVKQKLDVPLMRVIGDKADSCSKISLLPGAWGGKLQMTTIIEDKPDVLIVGEIAEWETAEYVRDARALGDKISLIITGHAMSEEPGMIWLAEWLQPKLPGIPITHITAGNPLKFI